MNQATQAPAAGRETYLDALRALSLFVVVAWHWVFTLIVWKDDGPHASNPIGSTSGLWLLTWLFQVMPVFFFVGGYVHGRSWQAARAAGRGYGVFIRRRLGRLVVPAAGCLVAAAVLRAVLRAAVSDVEWVDRAIVLALSPLWFLCVYIVLVLVAPAAYRVHELAGEAALVALVGLAAWVDLARFHYDVGWAAWANWFIVWVAVHQFGFFYDRLRAGRPQAHLALALGGIGALTVLTNMGLYPRSMVGVPQESISNMGPPTLCIIGLAAFQVGVVLLVAGPVSRWLYRPRPAAVVGWATRRSMTVFLWHSWGFAVAYGVLRVAGLRVPETTTWGWWAQRPLWALVPVVPTAVLVLAFSRLDRSAATA